MSRNSKRKIWVPKTKTEPKPEPEPETESEPFGFLNHPCLESVQAKSPMEWKQEVLMSMSEAKRKLQSMVDHLDKTKKTFNKAYMFQDSALEASPENTILLVGFYVSFHELHKKIDDLEECTKEATSFDFP